MHTCTHMHCRACVDRTRIRSTPTHTYTPTNIDTHTCSAVDSRLCVYLKELVHQIVQWSVVVTKATMKRHVATLSCRHTYTHRTYTHTRTHTHTHTHTPNARTDELPHAMTDARYPKLYGIGIGTRIMHGVCVCVCVCVIPVRCEPSVELSGGRSAKGSAYSHTHRDPHTRTHTVECRSNSHPSLGTGGKVA